jgi:hypothetical protein
MKLNPRSPEVRKIVAAAFPHYRGRKVSLACEEKTSIHSRFWDGGSKSEWMAVELETSKAAAPDKAFTLPPGYGGPSEDPVLAVPPGFALVEHIIFCGKDCGVVIHISPATASPALTEAA